MVHGRTGDVEGKGGDRLVHENTKVVPKVGTSDAECPHGGQDEGVTGEEKRDRGVLDCGGEEHGVCGLLY